ncbi:MAG: PspC domain-containing protein [Muribaculaceae bacterium]|nr:PspC domain-containing protein [Muribaculaceae bacterium]
MKKAFPANINGKIFYIDEDAYNLLNSYLTQLRNAFSGPEGEEIVSDIESRIGELFEDLTARGQGVITLSDVNNVIETMGRPEQISGEEEPRECGSATPPPYVPPVKKRLYRDEQNNVFGGVLSGLGIYLGWDITLLRILTVVLTIYCWPCLFAYLIAWMIIPPAKTPRQILEMRGEPVTVSSIGTTVMGNDDSAASVFNKICQIAGTFIMALFGFCGAIGAFTLSILALCVIAGMIMLSTTGTMTLLDNFDITATAPYIQGWAMTLVFLCIALPFMLLAWAGCTVVFKAPTIPRNLLISGLIFEALLIVGAVVLWNLC